MFLLCFFLYHFLSEVDGWDTCDIFLSEGSQQPISFPSLRTIRLPRFDPQQLLLIRLILSCKLINLFPEAYKVNAFFLCHRVLTHSVILKFSPALSQCIPTVLAFSLLIFRVRLVRKVLCRLEIKLWIVEWQVQWWEAESVLGHLELQGHLSIIEKPEFTVEADLVETLDESDVAADVKLVLELRMHLEKHFALFDESKGCLLS